ncbi:PREDICTED: uncharacterized protein At5g39570-like [Nelumbo nucifera]|uniref:Uncharacterized protein n=2 Tax=Nelumbo nucifera TaxID=4432 RepID=A0A822YB49_NELNU|nr:PREDICTED: uncharacterized protein At5g39570-like [Nelumbo nucifera]DAD31334.1 TPA_asm: hypothetical protein HUJ06_010185 [Nelumbo nucifera]
MAFYSGGEDAVDDFDEYDPTPYGGGYDIVVTYGQSLEPSDEICYPISSSSSDIDCERPQYSYSEASAYGDEALQAEYSSYNRPNRPRPRPQPGRRPEEDAGGNEYGYGESQEVGEYGYESGYKRNEEYGYGGRNERPNDEDEEENRRRRPSYGRQEEEEEYRSPSYGREEEEEYRRPSYGRSEEEEERRRYQESSYGGEEYGGPQYGDNNSDGEENKRHHHRHHHLKQYDDE